MSWIWKLGVFFVAIGVVKLVMALIAKKRQVQKELAERLDVSADEMLK